MSEIVKKADESASQPEAKEAPYGAEYAKSGRAACKGCREPIQKVKNFFILFFYKINFRVP